MKAATYFNNFKPVSSGKFGAEYSLDAIMQFRFISNVNSFHSEIAEKGLNGKYLTDKQLWVLSFELEKRAESFSDFLAQKEKEYELEQEAKKESTIEYNGFLIEESDGIFSITNLDGSLTDEYLLSRLYHSLDKAKAAIDEAKQDQDEDYW